MEIGSKRRADDEDDDKNNAKRKLTESPSSKNWNDLPVEMKMACIQWMDFETRCNLWQTSRAAQPLVENHKRFPVSYLEVRIAVLKGIVWMRRTISTKGTNSIEKITLPTTGNELKELEVIFRLGAIERVRLATSVLEESCNPFANFPPDVEVIVDHLELRSMAKFATPVLRQCKTLKSIALTKQHSMPQHVYEIPCIYNTPHVKLSLSQAPSKCKPQSNYAIRLVQKWIDHDCPIGQRLEVTGCEQNVYESFLKKFKKRVVSVTNAEIRISTNNHEKHIVLRDKFYGYPLSCAIVGSLD